MRAVRADAADVGRQMKYNFGPNFVEESSDVILAGEIAIAFARNGEIDAASPAKPTHEMPTEKPAAAGDESRMLREVHP